MNDNSNTENKEPTAPGKTFMSRRGCMVSLIVVGVVGFIALRPVWDFARKVDMENSFKGLMTALHDYHDQHGHFPPARVVDESGNVHSWRSFLVHPSTGYTRTKRWDSGLNRKASCGWQDTFNGNGYSCVAIIGDETVWPMDAEVKINDIRDGTSNTVMVLLIKDAGIGWWEPRDLLFDGQKLTIEGDPNRPITLEGGMMGTADASVSWIDAPELLREHLPALVGKDDGIPVQLPTTY